MKAARPNTSGSPLQAIATVHLARSMPEPETPDLRTRAIAEAALHVASQAGPVFWTRQTRSLSDSRAVRGQGSKRDIDTTGDTRCQSPDLAGAKSRGGRRCSCSRDGLWQVPAGSGLQLMPDDENLCGLREQGPSSLTPLIFGHRKCGVCPKIRPRTVR